MQPHENLSLTDIEGEVWKPITGYEQFYHVSNMGRVKMIGRTKSSSLPNTDICLMKPKILSQYKTERDYFRIAITNDDGKQRKFWIHQLVCIAFLPNPHNKPQVNHIDGNPSNNKLENLEWVTPKENMQHAHKMGLMNPAKGHEHSLSKSVYQYGADFNLIKIWESANIMSIELGISRNVMERCYSNGFYFSYEPMSLEQLSQIKIKPSTKRRKIEQYTFGGELIKTFNSMSDAERKTGVLNTAILKCCKGQIKQSGGYVWKYAK